MANTGKFCILADSGDRAGLLGRAFEKHAYEHPSLKNLHWDLPPHELSRTLPGLVVGACDGLTPAEMRRFLNGREVGGIRILVADAVYCERWEEVL
jgi:hypothetical protein